MKYLPKDAQVWAIVASYYTENTPEGWKDFEGNIVGWGSYSKFVKEDFWLKDTEMFPWNEGIGVDWKMCFYIFSQPIDGYVGFIFPESLIQIKE